MPDKGYGVILDKCKFKEDAVLLLMDRALELNDEILDAYAVSCSNYGFSRDTAEAKRFFVENFTDDYGCGSDAEGLLARVIDDADFDGAEVFVSKDGCLYVQATVPADDEEKEILPTQEEIRNLLAIYLNPLLEEPAEICWLNISD